MTSLVLWMACLTAQGSALGETPLLDFGMHELPAYVRTHNASMEPVRHDGTPARRVRFERVDWPNVFVHAPDGVWDWSGFAGMAVSLYNPGTESVTACLRVDNAGADGLNHCNNADAGIPPKSRAVLSLRFNTGADEHLWGMRGVPGRGPRGTGPRLDPAKVTAFQVFLNRPAKPCELIFERAWLFGQGDTPLPMPFIDAFGQYKHADWPGKLKSESELRQRGKREARALHQHPQLPGRDRFGGWANGPLLKATGWFRTEQVDGSWWLVTPEGRLFFSVGMDCVGTWEHTFVTGRENWFEWLPERERGPFSGMYSHQKGAHSGAEAIGGEGFTFGFYTANLYRKYGEQWPELWRENAYARLRAWGFNTIANWSQADVLEHATLPYVVSTNISEVRPIEGGSGYWAKMKDVFAPEFETRAEAAFQWLAQTHAKNPLCIGYFVDNELAWEGFRRGVLESPVEQPCRQAFIQDLKAKYGTLEALNTAWGVNVQDWASLRTPETPNEAANQDLDDFTLRFARRYFQGVAAACKKIAPNQLFLGCRFAGPPHPLVERACAEFVDVMSYNLYYQTIPADRWAGEHDLGRPIIIGEFHFGALDRGMFHTGLRATANQKERAESYAGYVRSVAAHPAFVGCHWFQYVDEPNTGRWFDGENYNIGFVDVTDTPYRELSRAARKVHRDLYEWRIENAARP